MRRGVVFALFLFGCSGPEPGPPPSRQAALDGPKLLTSADEEGTLASFSTNGFDTGATNAYFTALGPNGRTCGSCHRRENGWTISADYTRSLAASDPTDPLFAPVDGSDCPPESPLAGPDAARSTLLAGYGLIRVELPVPDGADFALARASNPEHCKIAPDAGHLFLFRRPLPTASLLTLSTVMWDGRETLQKIITGPGTSHTGPLLADLEHQDEDAAAGHEQSTLDLVGSPILEDALDFETSLFSAQLAVGATALDGDGARGGPAYAAQVATPQFHIGENDPLGPLEPGFDRDVFRIYAAWEPGASGWDALTPVEKAIGRGERLFNERTFTIADVPGLNSSRGDPLANPADPLFDQPVQGTCSTCHNSFDLGQHSTALPLNIGVTLAAPTDNAGGSIAGLLDTDRLPVYRLRRTVDGATIEVTDPARALISGRWVDVGKTKGPTLRGLAGRAPYFHDGSAKDLRTVVAFYDARFDIGLTDAEKEDLVAFLGAL